MLLAFLLLLGKTVSSDEFHGVKILAVNELIEANGLIVKIRYQEKKIGGSGIATH